MKQYNLRYMLFFSFDKYPFFDANAQAGFLSPPPQPHFPFLKGPTPSLGLESYMGYIGIRHGQMSYLEPWTHLFLIFLSTAAPVVMAYGVLSLPEHWDLQPSCEQKKWVGHRALDAPTPHPLQRSSDIN